MIYKHYQQVTLMWIFLQCIHSMLDNTNLILMMPLCFIPDCGHMQLFCSILLTLAIGIAFQRKEKKRYKSSKIKGLYNNISIQQKINQNLMDVPKQKYLMTCYQL